jgi:BMFP domain-containing protein YqiC
LSARLAPVLAASGLSAQKIVRYIETVAMRAATREVTTPVSEVRRNQHRPTTSNMRPPNAGRTIIGSKAHTMSHEDANSGRTQSLFERLIQSNDPLLGQIDRNAKSLLQSALGKLDVVSREEFDAQTAVLQRTRQRLETLEQSIEALNDALEQPIEP